MPKITMLNNVTKIGVKGPGIKEASNSDKSPQTATSKFSQVRNSASPGLDNTLKTSIFSHPKSIVSVDSCINLDNPKHTLIHLLQHLSTIIAESNPASAKDKIDQICMMIQTAEQRICGNGSGSG
ncbi:hypothetical protein [Microbulbifer variabilis]|uniref:hypothetical protein n=1 Tax=Microbulbifer variabilis TaxID=266805 RepID=UPI001CFE5C4E|nr:hypothetical protein [Microbulbifer variabilis]